MAYVTRTGCKKNNKQTIIYKIYEIKIKNMKKIKYFMIYFKLKNTIFNYKQTFLTLKFFQNNLRTNSNTPFVTTYEAMNQFLCFGTNSDTQTYNLDETPISLFC